MPNRTLVSFPTAVNKYVKGGDLFFMEEDSYFDEYTYLNSQTLHVLKMTLRLKSDIMDWGTIQQWCKVGIIVDTDIDDIKYVLELTENGFKKTEYVQRTLQMKADGQIFGIRRLLKPLSKE